MHCSVHMCWVYLITMIINVLKSTFSDSINQRLYWVDAKLNKIMTSLTDGSEVTTVLSDAMQIEHPFSITVFQVC